MNPFLYKREEAGGQSMEILERVEWEGGAKVYFKDRPYPLKGYLTQDMVWALDTVKKLMRHPLVFKEIAWATMRPYILEDRYLSPFALEFRTLLTHFFSEKTSNILVHVLEYDNAYRIRLQDLFNESSVERLTKKPIRELWRLLEINKRRDYAEVHNKIKKAGTILILLLCIPAFRRTFRHAISLSDFTPQFLHVYLFEH